MLTKIISGGQTGADQGGLQAAAELGIPTGGKMPKGFRTERGPQCGLGPLYGLEELASHEYAPRTRYNVVDSDATVIFGKVSSPGSRTTRKMCIDSKKPYLVIEDCKETSLRLFTEFLAMYKVKILNVAGNRESRNPGIQDSVHHFLVEALEENGDALHAGRT
jgi:hypothetical protein